MEAAEACFDAFKEMDSSSENGQARVDHETEPDRAVTMASPGFYTRFRD